MNKFYLLNLEAASVSSLEAETAEFEFLPHDDLRTAISHLEAMLDLPVENYYQDLHRVVKEWIAGLNARLREK